MGAALTGALRPDVIVTLGSHRIGIEHTEILRSAEEIVAETMTVFYPHGGGVIVIGAP
jgi:hypothetical protein